MFESAGLLLTVLLLLGSLLRSLLAACAALLLMLARALVLVAHLATTLLTLLILATLLLVAALAGLLFLLLLSRLGLATLLLSGLATLLLSHCCLQVQVAAGCRVVPAAIGVPHAKVGGMASVGHTGSRCATCAVPRFTTHACFSRAKGGAPVRLSIDVGTCFPETACDRGGGRQ